MKGKIFKNEVKSFGCINKYRILKLREHLIDEITVVILLQKRGRRCKEISVMNYNIQNVARKNVSNNYFFSDLTRVNCLICIQKRVGGK
jgi:hypothetical protein